MTKMERKSEYNKLKKTLKDVWTIEMDTDEDVNSDKMDVPSHYKKYIIQDRKIIVQQPMRELKEPGTSYNGPKKAKKINLTEPGEEPKPAYIATDLTEEEEQLLIATLKQYKDVFAWSYKDLKGVDPSICQHIIPLKSDAKPSRQRPYTYNDTFARKRKKEIDKLKEAEFIYEIEHTDWVSPIVMVPKKNNAKLRVCVNLKKVNAATIRDNYPLPITDHVIERVAGRETYSFLDGFSGYNQLPIKPEDEHKTAFATEWSIFAYRVKEVHAFMGYCGYYRRFIYLYAIIAKPLYALITKFEWTDECEKAFQILKQQLISAPILKASDWDKIFHVHVDASAFAIGCILAQPGEKNMDFPISYSSRQLNSAKKSYKTTEREDLGMIYAVKKFRHYLLSSFSYIVDFLTTTGILPEIMTTSRVRAITKEVENYVLIKDNLYKRGKDGQLRMCATEEEYISILQQAHSGEAGGHFSVEKMAKSILYAGIWWLTLFMDAEEFVKRCDDCQRAKTPRGRDDMPLRPMMRERAFAKWGIDFVGPIAPPAYKSHAQYIIVVIDYLTMWVEGKATTKNDAKTTAQFLYENIFTRYGLPIEIVSDRGIHFINKVIENLLDEFMVIHRKSAPYHPQANGQAESTNKILVTVLTKIVSESRADWDQKLHSALWAYQVAYKTSIDTTPFNMVYGIQAILPLEFLIPTLQVAKDLEWTVHELSEQLEILEKLDETRLRVVVSIYAQKRNMKSFFDQHVINKEFATGNYVLMYTLKQHSRKLHKRGNGPYVIHDISPSGAIKLATLEGEKMRNWISGCRLKKYLLPLTTKMLAKIHGAKERKIKLKETKAQAQEEARIKILKRKQKLQQQRQPSIEETTPVPLAAIRSCEQLQIGIDV
ncbi:hypothetical protein L7F22_001609 [Adiantum nelumboides]|nr:hypothetical protein [Adiantum nelumboides]